MRVLVWLPIAVVLSLCGSAAADSNRLALADWPVRFFLGKSEGLGEMRIMFSRAKPFRVRSAGRVRKDGTLVLRQTIRIASEKPSTREWRLTRVARSRYAGTLTDAIGQVTGEVSGNRLVLVYTMKGTIRPRMRQVLTLQPDGRTIANELRATKLGLPIASVRETIIKMP